MLERILVALALASATVVRTTPAECDEPVSLEYIAPDECPSAEAFGASVTERLERGRVADGPSETTFRVTITLTEGVYLGRLAEVQGAGADPAETLTLREIADPDCAETARAMALVTALAVQARVSDSAPAPEPPPGSRDAAPGPGREPDATAEREPPPDDRGTTPMVGPPLARQIEPGRPERGDLDPSIGARASIATAQGPGVLPGADLFVALSPSDRAWLLQLSLGGQRGSTVERGPGEARFSFVGGRVSGCAPGVHLGDALALFPCAWLETGVVIAEGFIDVPETVTDPWLAVGVTALGTYRVGDLVFVVEAGPVFPVTHEDRFVFGAPGQSETEIHDVPTLGAFVALGAGWVIDGT